jgi:hypothetical protein
MKLSDAILISGMVKPQGRGPDSIGSSEAPCALGGALDVIGKQRVGQHELNYQALCKAWPFLNQQAHHPVNGIMYDILSIVWRLNDVHYWTHVQIAEWVRTVEPQAEPETEVKNDAQTAVAAELSEEAARGRYSRNATLTSPAPA